MALLGDEYNSSDEDVSSQPVAESRNITANSIVAAPEVSLDVWSYHTYD